MTFEEWYLHEFAQSLGNIPYTGYTDTVTYKVMKRAYEAGYDQGVEDTYGVFCEQDAP